MRVGGGKETIYLLVMHDFFVLARHEWTEG